MAGVAEDRWWGDGLGEGGAARRGPAVRAGLNGQVSKRKKRWKVEDEQCRLDLGLTVERGGESTDPFSDFSQLSPSRSRYSQYSNNG